MANTNALEMDWAPVMAAGDKALLANINTIMRFSSPALFFPALFSSFPPNFLGPFLLSYSFCSRIDLVCKLAAPAAAGAILDAVPVFWAAVGIAGWNLLSVVLEMVMQRCVYDSCPALHTLNRDKLVKKKQNVEELDENIDSSEERQDDQEIGKGAKSCLSEQLLGNPTDSLDEGVDVKQRQKQRWSVAVFFSYSEAAPALCLSLLYFTVLSGGFLMVGHPIVQLSPSFNWFRFLALIILVLPPLGTWRRLATSSTEVSRKLYWVPPRAQARFLAS
jgi:hypothetical protein